ncbi:MAG: hypothetical protein ABI865_05250 [Nitrosospira sp.]
MENNLILLAWLLCGVTAGAVAVWRLNRVKNAAAYEAGKTIATAELAAANAQLEATRKSCGQAETDLAAAHVEYDKLREWRDTARDEGVRLRERVVRITALEAELAQSTRTLLEQREEVTSLRESNGRLESSLSAEQMQHTRIRGELTDEKSACQAARENVSKLSATISEINAVLESERNQSGEKLALLTEAREQMTDQFKVLAAEILDEKVKVFGEQNHASLTTLLDPLKEKIKDFKKKWKRCTPTNRRSGIRLKPKLSGWRSSTRKLVRMRST